MFNLTSPHFSRCGYCWEGRESGGKSVRGEEYAREGEGGENAQPCLSSLGTFSFSRRLLVPDRPRATASVTLSPDPLPCLCDSLPCPPPQPASPRPANYLRLTNCTLLVPESEALALLLLLAGHSAALPDATAELNALNLTGVAQVSVATASILKQWLVRNSQVWGRCG